MSIWCMASAAQRTAACHFVSIDVGAQGLPERRLPGHRTLHRQHLLPGARTESDAVGTRCGLQRPERAGLVRIAVVVGFVRLEPSLAEQMARDHALHHLQHGRHQLGLQDQGPSGVTCTSPFPASLWRDGTGPAREAAGTQEAAHRTVKSGPPGVCCVQDPPVADVSPLKSADCRCVTSVSIHKRRAAESVRA